MGGLRLLAKRVEPEPELVELFFVAPPAPPSRGKAAAPPSHMLQYGAAPLLECLLGFQLEPLEEPELEPCQIGPKCHDSPSCGVAYASITLKSE